MDKELELVEKIHEYCKQKAIYYTGTQDERADAYRDVFNYIYDQVKEVLNDN